MNILDTPYLAGLRHLSANQPATAIPLFRAALAEDPAHAGARRNLIRALSLSGDHEATIAETVHAPLTEAEPHYLRGTALNALGRPVEAVVALTTAVTLDPAHAPAWLNLGNAHAELDDLATAETLCRHAIALDPALIEAHVTLGFFQTAQGKIAEARTTLEAATQRWPDNANAHWNLAVATLLAGDLTNGFARYEWRKRHHRYRRDFVDLPGPIWKGEPPEGRTILVRAEQGFGDTIQFSRYLTEIARRGGQPILVCDRALIPFLNRIEGVRFVDRSSPLPPYDAWIDQMSLPRVLGTSMETIPAAEGYLRVAPASIEIHRATLPPIPRVGLAWAGNPRHGNDRRRTPPPEVFAPLLARPNIHFVNLVPGRPFPGLAMPARPPNDFGDTASLISALDLTISVDTAVAHVAGALGRPVWIMLAHAPDWRWLRNRTDSPWYRSARLFRQPNAGDWPAVVANLAEALEIGLTGGNENGRSDDG